MSCNPLFILKKRTTSVNDLCFWGEPASKLKLVSVYQGGPIDLDVWDCDIRRVVTTVQSDTTADMLSVDAINHNLVTLDRYGWLKLTDGNTMQVVSKLGFNDVGFCKISLLPDDPKIILALPGENKSSVTIWSLKDSSIISRLIPDQEKLGTVMNVKLFSQYLVVGYENGSVLLWHHAEQKILFQVKIFDEPVMSLDAFQRDDVIECVCGSVCKEIHRIRFYLKEERSEVKKIEVLNDGISSLKIRNDQKIFASGGWDHQIRLFGMKKMKSIARLNYHSDRINSIDFSKGHIQLLAASSKDNKISVYDVFNS